MLLDGTLICKDKQEPFGDEIYIKIDGKKVAGVWKKMKEGKTRHFTSEVKGKFSIEVWEQDRGRDDFIGSRTLNAEDLVGTGQQSTDFKGRGAHYALLYSIS